MYNKHEVGARNELRLEKKETGSIKSRSAFVQNVRLKSSVISISKKTNPVCLVHMETKVKREISEAKCVLTPASTNLVILLRIFKREKKKANEVIY